MQLLPTYIRKNLPTLYAQEDLGHDAIVYVRFFTPDAGWTWYVTEFDGKDIFFGLVDGLELEFGYFSLSELTQIRGKLGLPIERDLHFKPTPLREIYEELQQRRRSAA